MNDNLAALMISIEGNQNGENFVYTPLQSTTTQFYSIFGDLQSIDDYPKEILSRGMILQKSVSDFGGGRGVTLTAVVQAAVVMVITALAAALDIVCTA